MLGFEKTILIHASPVSPRGPCPLPVYSVHIVSAAHQCQSEQPALAGSVRTVVAGLAQMTTISRITRFCRTLYHT